jgi:hypothetical protein
MDLKNFLRRYADEIGGQFIEYDPLHAIIIVPVSGGRAQTVLANVIHNDLYNRQLISISSKVCPAREAMDMHMLLTQTAFFNYSRFAIRENFLQVEAVGPFNQLQEDVAKEMIQEVANLADQFEMKLTGADVQ